ncbi:MAG: hypothetical protein AB1730_03370 [Myxococcota bacterium]
MSGSTNGVSGNGPYGNIHLLEIDGFIQIQTVDQKTARVDQSSTHSDGPAGPSGRADVSKERHEALQSVLTKPQGQGYAKDPLEDLKNDKDYTKLVADIEFFESLILGFAHIDQQFGGAFWSGLGDGKLDMGNITAAASDPCAPGHEVAKKLLARPDMLLKLKGSDGLYSMAKLEEVIQGLKTDKKSKEDQARAATSSVPPRSSEPSTEATSNPPPQTPPNQSTSTESKASEIKVDMGQVSGGDPLSRSTERLSNALSSIETQIDDLIVKMGKETDPAKLKQLEAQLNKLERLQSMFSKILERLQTMIQNMAQMYHKIQMAAIQNIGR